MTIDPPHDPMGQAVLDHQQGKPTKKLRVLSSMFDEEEMPVPHLFRTYSEMPRLEQLALDLCKGKVLDVGACVVVLDRLLMTIACYVAWVVS